MGAARGVHIFDKLRQIGNFGARERANTGAGL